MQTADQFAIAEDRYYDRLAESYHGRDEIPEHVQLQELLTSIATEDDCGDALDAYVDTVIDDTSDLRDWIKLAVSGKDDAEVGRLIRNAAEKYARAEVADRS